MKMTSTINKKAWAIRKEAAIRFNCPIKEVSWKECLTLARSSEKTEIKIEAEAKNQTKKIEVALKTEPKKVSKKSEPSPRQILYRAFLDGENDAKKMNDMMAGQISIVTIKTYLSDWRHGRAIPKNF